MLTFDVPADVEYGGIRSALESAGKRIGSDDLLIAHAYATCPRFFLGFRIEINRLVILGGISKYWT